MRWICAWHSFHTSHFTNCGVIDPYLILKILWRKLLLHSFTDWHEILNMPLIIKWDLHEISNSKTYGIIALIWLNNLVMQSTSTFLHLSHLKNLRAIAPDFTKFPFITLCFFVSGIGVGVFIIVCSVIVLSFWLVTKWLCWIIAY